MGRYDKMRYHNGSSYVQPSEIYVHNGSSWVYVGANTDLTSTSNREIYTHNGSSWVKVTLNGKKYLLMNGQSGISLGNTYQFYKFKFEMEVEFTSLRNQMIYEAYVDSTHYARIGLFNSSGTWYIYFKSQYGSTVAELSTLYATNKESIQLNTRYKLVLDNSASYMTGTVTNTSSGLAMTIRTSGGSDNYRIGGFYNYYACKTVLFGGSNTTDRPMYAKIYNCSIQTCGYTSTVIGGDFLNDNITVGASTWPIANAVGGGSALTITGSFVDEWY